VASAVVITSASLLITIASAWSQVAKTVRIVTPFAPGGAASVLAGTVADQISKSQDFTAVIENKPGEGTLTATEAVARSPADGNTVLVTNLALLINAHLRKTDYDPLTSFEPICRLVNSASFIAVNSASPYHTLSDFIDAARAKPGELTAAINPASGPHIAFEALKRRANVDITFVPYAGSAPAVADLLGGRVVAMADNYVAMSEYVNAGKLRVLATFARNRIEALPTIPTAAESGYKDVEYEGWWGLFAPANTPKDSVARLVSWSKAATHAPDARQKLEALGLFQVDMCGAEFAELLRVQYDYFGQVIRQANIKLK
jgi:tripartite-type tricarboxylate transporter receptor subunit TctC